MTSALLSISLVRNYVAQGIRSTKPACSTPRFCRKGYPDVIRLMGAYMHCPHMYSLVLVEFFSSSLCVVRVALEEMAQYHSSGGITLSSQSSSSFFWWRWRGRKQFCRWQPHLSCEYKNNQSVADAWRQLAIYSRVERYLCARGPTMWLWQVDTNPEMCCCYITIDHFPSRRFLILVERTRSLGAGCVYAWELLGQSNRHMVRLLRALLPD